TRAMRDWKKDLAPGQRLDPEQENELAGSVLQNLIDRTLLVQEARRMMKQPKKADLFNRSVDEHWRDTELPPLLKKYGVNNEYELKVKMEERGESLSHLRETYRQESLAQFFIKSKVGTKLNPGLPEMRAYYQEHLHDFDRPAQVTWREAVVLVDDKTDRVQ